MLARLLRQLDSPRRHLALLVGLLVLTFVFSGLLGREVQRAEKARQATAQGVLRDMVAGAVRDWGVYLQRFAGTSLYSVMADAAGPLIRRPDMPLDSLMGRATRASFCADCSQTLDSTSAFEIWLEGGSVTSRAGVTDEVGSALLARVNEGDYAVLHDRFGTFLHVSGHSGRVVGYATYVVRGEADEPIRIVGFVVPEAVLQEIAATMFNLLPVVPPTLANGLPNDSFFVAVALPASADAAPLPAGEFAATEVLAAGAISGLTLQVGVLPDADRRLVIGGTANARLPLLLTLLSVIAVLIVVALLLVRREAELVRLRADFISGVSHELRTPLAQIRMFTETLLLGRVRSDIERRRSLEIIDQEARRLTHLVENVLLFSKREGGRDTRLAPEPTLLATEVRSAAESFLPMCRSAGVELRTELQDDLAAEVDRGALRQILVNLVDNALKYGPAGQRITVGVALFDSAARLWVDDEGPGIPVPDRQRVFDPFHRLPRDVEQRTTGSGIGLAVVRELARMHGGRAMAEDAPGGGTRIIIEFPQACLRPESSSGLAAAS
jgi:signal transduction histidine kinase